MKKKLREQAGETLAESLASLLIAVLAVMMLTASITASARINLANRTADETFEEDLRIAEGYGGTASEGTLKFTFEGREETVTVDIYGDDGGDDLISYKPKIP